ncbi:hypothetical protein ACLQ2R_22145 [Streptosporangium sp. DT93]|uniref:hypothetical protein n=1 Tax=Streptosporangium sp. DT93 TaxID=3393428 RepID=UPI003CF1521D
MALFTHLTAEKNIRSVRRAGIRARSRGDDGPAGVYCLPIVPSYQFTHQWGRELRRGGRRTMVAVDFRIPDGEQVLVGHYRREPVRLSAAEAVALVAAHEDPRGGEVFVLRPIAAGEIHRVRAVNRVTGWRYMPNAHGVFPCPCCLARGEYGGAILRRKAEARGYH